MRKRILALLMVLTMVLLLCACGDADQVLQQTETALLFHDASRHISNIYVIRYTSRLFLTDSELAENPEVYSQIPSSGTAVVIAGSVRLYDCEIYFFDANGNLALAEDVKALEAASDQAYRACSANPTWSGLAKYEKASDLSGYFMTIGTNAYCGAVSRGKEGVPARMESDIWYALSSKQMEKVLG